MQIKKFTVLIILLVGLILFFGCVEEQKLDNASQSLNDSVEVSDNPYSGTCPKGKDDTLCTGECGNFIDNDKDGYCDRAQ